MAAELDLHSVRAKKARLGKRIGKTGALLCGAAAVAFVALAIVLTLDHEQFAYALFAPAAFLWMIATWWKLDLSILDPIGSELNERLHRDVLQRLKPGRDQNPKLVWQQLAKHWQLLFFSNHLMVPASSIEQGLSENPSDLLFVWDKAAQLANDAQCKAIEPGHIAGALILTNAGVMQALTQLKITEADVLAVNGWLGRDLATMRQDKTHFGGIGRDWATGFTPQLNRFGHNISMSIQQHGAHYGSLLDSPGVTGIKSAFSQGASGIALVGESGVGKTKHIYALAQSLLAESKDRRIEHRQLIGLSPSPIISAAQRPGDLEHLVNVLMSEASHAGNIILFFDDAQLFFTTGPGAVNVTQILLPVLQSRSVQCVFAMNPRDYQKLKSDNPTFAGLLTPVVINEPDQTSIMQAVEDAATQFEVRHKVLITYDALKEAFRLSGRYDQDSAYPGKAIRLLEQALTHANQSVVSAASIQAAIEQTTGVKASTAAPVEADQLLNLEDAIHQRMINQSRAVTVVANALRRSRAGVSSPNRPIGSFLFLGPTGVGKTELCKAIAATYFSDETNMIRLDMSEYQQESDVSRLLSGGQNETSSLILKVREKPFSVVLLDEIEKAHPNILNLLLQMLDEGQLTDSTGRAASFKDAIVICTSNAGADEIRKHIEAGEELEAFEQQFTDQLINSGQFKPELLNRFDEIVLFRPLKPEELTQVVRLMLGGVNKTLQQQQISVELTDAAIDKIVSVGNDPRLGARPMRRALQRAVEDTVAQKILRQEAKPGDKITLDVADIPAKS